MEPSERIELSLRAYRARGLPLTYNGGSCSKDSMATINGIGSFHYGEDDRQPDGSYVATLYFVIFFLPIVPLRTERLKKLAVENEQTHLEIGERLPIRWAQVRRTYFRCWILLPLTLFWPMIGLFAIAGVMHAIAGRDTTSRFMQAVAPVALGFASIYFIAMAAYLLWRARRTGLRL